jgi:hypothetical protein
MKTWQRHLTFRRLAVALGLTLLLALGLLWALSRPWQGEWVTVLDSRLSSKESYIETLEHGRIDVPADMVHRQIKLIPTRQYRLKLSGWSPFTTHRTLESGILDERVAPTHLQKQR